MIKLQEAELWNSAVVQKICLDLWYCLFWKEQNGKTCRGRKHLLHFLDSCTFSCHTKWCWSNWCRLGCICVHILNQSLTGKILKVPDNIDIFIHTNMAKAVSIKNVQMQGLYYDFFFCLLQQWKTSTRKTDSFSSQEENFKGIHQKGNFMEFLSSQ